MTVTQQPTLFGAPPPSAPFAVGAPVRGLVEGVVYPGVVLRVHPDGGYTVQYTTGRRGVRNLACLSYQPHTLEQPEAAT